MSWYNPLTWFPTKLPFASAKGKSFFSLNGKIIYYNLENELDYKQAYLTCSPLKAIVNKRAQMFINGKVEVLNKNTDTKKRGEYAKQLKDLLKKPNVVQSWKQFFAQFHMYIDIFGYCPLLKVEPVGMPGTLSAIWCLPPWLFDVEFTGKWRDQNDINKIYKAFYLTWNGDKKELKKENVTIVYDNSIGTDNDSNFLIPDSRIKSNEYPISNIIAAYTSRNTLITKKGAIGILSNMGRDTAGPLPMKEGEKEVVQEDFKRYGITGQEWQVIITDASLQWQAMTFPTRDLMLFEEIEDDILRLCDNMGLYSDLMGAIKKSTFANLNEAKKAQYQDYIIPDAEARIEQLSAFIIPESENSYLSITYSHLPILQENAKEKGDAVVATNTGYEILYRNGMVTKNQWAVAAGIEALPTGVGDKYIYELDSTPLAVKLGVGGTDAMMKVLTSTIMADQKKKCLQILFGLTPADADSMVGEDPKPENTPGNGNPTQ